MQQFIDAAIEAGFTEKQAEFMYEHLAEYPHTHSMDEIDGLEEALEDDEDDDEPVEDE